MNNQYEQKPEDNGIYAGPGFRGLINAHKLGMSWTKIGLVVGLMVALFIGYTYFMMRSSSNQADDVQRQVEEATKKAQEDSLKMQAQIEADVQRKLQEAGVQQ